MRKGEITEAVVLAELVKRGYTVLIPFGARHYDFMVETPSGDFKRVQVKTARLRNGTIQFKAVSVLPGRKPKAVRYKGSVDAFLAYCPDNGKMYWIPESNLDSGIYLRLDAPKNGNLKAIRWAKDYELP